MYALVEQLGLETFPTWNDAGRLLLDLGGKQSPVGSHKGATPRLNPIALADLAQGLARFERLARSVDPARPWAHPKAAQLVGININVVIAFTFGLGSALAGAGGILYALNYPSIDPLMGVMPGLKAFVAAVLGGIGNIPGAALGGLLLGTVETFVNGSQWSTYKDAIAFAVLIIILLFRPAGLLGKFTVEKV